MKKVRCVVEVMVPDKVEFSEQDFAKHLRRDLQYKSVSLHPIEMAVRPIMFKEFGRVVQYGPDGARIEPKKPASFERLVLFGLYAILAIMVKPKDRVNPMLRKWFAEINDVLEIPKP